MPTVLAAAVLAVVGLCAPAGAVCGPTGNGRGDTDLSLRKTKQDLPSPLAFKYLPLSDNSLKQPGVAGSRPAAMPKPLPSKRASWNNTRQSSVDLATFKSEIEDEEKKFICVRGFVKKVQKSGAEAVNCNATGEADVDYHINLVANMSDGFAQSLVVEVTPQIRKAYGWTSAEMTGLQGKDIQVYGLKMFDQWHRHAPKTGAHRMSAWEVHPILFILWEKTTGSGSWAWLQKSGQPKFPTAWGVAADPTCAP